MAFGPRDPVGCLHRLTVQDGCNGNVTATIGSGKVATDLSIIGEGFSMSVEVNQLFDHAP